MNIADLWESFWQFSANNPVFLVLVVFLFYAGARMLLAALEQVEEVFLEDGRKE